MADNLTFSIAVSTFDRNDDLYSCLSALSRQTYQDFDIIVTNGGRYDGVKNVAERFPSLKIKIIEQQRKGVVEARNLGWRYSPADIVCFIDDDLVVSPVWLEEIRRAFMLTEAIGGVSGPTIIPAERRKKRDFAYLLEVFGSSNNLLIRILGAAYKRIVLEDRLYDVGRILASGAFTPGSNYESCLRLNEIIEVDYLEACHMCFRRSLLEELGGFDYHYTGTGEWNEPDFSFKARRAGYKLVFNPKAVSEHRISQSGVFKARTNAYERSRNFIYFYFRNIKLNSLNKLLRFSANLCFINGYWFYKFLKSKNLDWLSGIRGSIVGLAKELWIPKK